MKIFIGVEMFQGLTVDAHLFHDGDEAEKWFEDYMDVKYSDYVRRVKKGEEIESILGNFDGTKVFEKIIVMQD